MITLSSIVKRAHEAYGSQLELRYLHPTLYLICKDPAFESLEDEERKRRFVEKTGLSGNGANQSYLASILSLVLVTPEERERDYDFLDVSATGRHWLPLLAGRQATGFAPVESAVPRAIHFYGYKGGQARSTVLAMLAQQLAEDGYLVLAVDADIEAPSLDAVFDSAASSPSQTLLGLAMSTQPIETRSAYTARGGVGRVDLIACRPVSAEYDMDFAAFALRSALDVEVLEEGLNRLRRHIEQMPKDRYDFVLLDHRSGLATSVLPVIGAYPGPTVICLRIDEQSSGAGALFDILLGQVKDTPGAYVSFSLDPEDTREKMLGRHGARISEFLDRLGEAVERGSSDYAGPDNDLPPEDFQRYWVSWFHDRAFVTDRFPALSEISEGNRQSLLQLREVLGLSGRKEPVVRERRRERRSTRLSPSGAGDEGVFIQTQEIARLFQPNTPITYIFGRKGTGKTRLLRELKNRGLGEPLIVAADEKSGGVSSSDAVFSDLANHFSNDPVMLWWTILAAALESDSTSGPAFLKSLKSKEHQARRKPKPLRISDIAELAARLPTRRVFLIDGIETAFRAAQLIEFVEALFKFLLTIQSDAKFSERVVVRLFLRTDLARRAFQNVEQQTAGRKLDLTWNTQSIFNFVLSRIGQLGWFQESFPDACKAIDREDVRIRAGQLPSAEYEPLLLEIFPRRLRRNNLQTLTFLKTYFSDAAGDDETRAAFYPRLFDAFLRFIAHPEELPQGSTRANPLEDGRVDQSLILAAHESASVRFLDEVKQELSVLLSLAERPAENDQRVTELLSAFDGLKTPFEFERRLEELQKLGGGKVEAADLRDALQRMKDIGMFEDRPGHAGWWRAGRLFKSALRMKYVRK
ncbi:MAG: AAA family ATPase [Verrucomicrobiae bacterium]|nr:AAA family ATPase [Verrucomicrobiae bacterium]